MKSRVKIKKPSYTHFGRCFECGDLTGLNEDSLMCEEHDYLKVIFLKNKERLKLIRKIKEAKESCAEKILKDLDLRKEEIIKCADDFLDPDDGYTVMGDFSKEIEELTEKGLTERESLLLIQGFHAAIDLILRKERARSRTKRSPK